MEGGVLDAHANCAKMAPRRAMTSHALYRIYPNGIRARISPRGHSFALELFDTDGRRRPDLPIIAASLDEARQLADDHAGGPPVQELTSRVPRS
jgi:hypothetical protein